MQEDFMIGRVHGNILSCAFSRDMYDNIWIDM